jgi:hypothetical protein
MGEESILAYGLTVSGCGLFVMTVSSYGLLVMTVGDDGK